MGERGKRVELGVGSWECGMRDVVKYDHESSASNALNGGKSCCKYSISIAWGVGGVQCIHNSQASIRREWQYFF